MVFHIYSQRLSVRLRLRSDKMINKYRLKPKPEKSEFAETLENIKWRYTDPIISRLKILRNKIVRASGYVLTDNEVTILIVGGLALSILALAIHFGIKRGVKSEVEGYVGVLSEMDLE